VAITWRFSSVKGTTFGILTCLRWFFWHGDSVGWWAPDLASREIKDCGSIERAWPLDERSLHLPEMHRSHGKLSFL